MNSFHRKLVYFKSHVVVALLLSMTLGFGIAENALAAAPTPLGGLILLKKITIPLWTPTGAATQTSTDVWSFDPSTNTMYFADRVNKGVSVIDTTTNTYLGTLKVPTCDVATNRPGSCPSGVLVAPDLHKLVVTDRNTVVIAGGATIDLKSIFIFDLRLLSAPPVKLDLPSGTNTDELDYDPLNHRAYVGNTAAPFFVTVVDLLTNTIVDQIPMPGSPEQPRFNPVDGFVYVTVPGAPIHAVLRIDTTKSGAAAIVGTLLTPGCDNRAIDIDPLTNDAFVGCGVPVAGDSPAPGAQLLVNLNGAMSIVNNFPGVNGTDTGQFNSNLRRFYTASSNNIASVSCATNAAGAAPVVGVFSAPTKSQPLGALVGADCSGTNGHDIGVDPVHNQVFMAVRQGPESLDPTFAAALANGHAGVLVWHDPAALAQPNIIEESSARLAALTSQGANGRVLFEDSHIVRARLSHLPAGTTALLNVTTTVGNEVVNCDKTGSTATCAGVLKGEALLGGNVLMSTGGAPLASGKIKHGDGGFGDDDHGEHHGHDD
jgi:DNA-binding beta-propeller fold protein YncE